MFGPEGRYHCSGCGSRVGGRQCAEWAGWVSALGRAAEQLLATARRGRRGGALADQPTSRAEGGGAGGSPGSGQAQLRHISAFSAAVQRDREVGKAASRRGSVPLRMRLWSSRKASASGCDSRSPSSTVQAAGGAAAPVPAAGWSAGRRFRACACDRRIRPDVAVAPRRTPGVDVGHGGISSATRSGSRSELSSGGPTWWKPSCTCASTLGWFALTVNTKSSPTRQLLRGAALGVQRVGDDSRAIGQGAQRGPFGILLLPAEAGRPRMVPGECCCGLSHAQPGCRTPGG